MKYISDNSSVQRSLNKTWVFIGIPFFLILGLTNILGFVLLEILDKQDSIYFITVIFSSLILAGIWGFLSSKIWFRYYIQKVTDPKELYERAIRNNIILKKQADKIVNFYSVDIKRRISKYQELEPQRFNEHIVLSNDYLSINNTKVKWEDTIDFRIVNNVNKRPGSVFYIEVENDERPIKIDVNNNMRKLEYLIDKYLNNYLSKEA